MKHVKKKMVGDVVVLYPEGMFTGGEETDELHAALIGSFKEGNGKLVVNLKNTEHLVSIALGALIAAHTHYAKKGGRICICHVNDRINMIFLITKLVMVFDTYETEEEAIASFEGWKAPVVPAEVGEAK